MYTFVVLISEEWSELDCIIRHIFIRGLFASCFQEFKHLNFKLHYFEIKWLN